MSKNPVTLAPDIQAERPRRRLLPILLLLAAVPPLAPVLRDAVALCHGQWRGILGTPSDVRTPALDAIGERIGEVRGELWYHVSGRFNRVPWNPRIILPIAVLVMGIAIVMLRQ